MDIMNRFVEYQDYLETNGIPHELSQIGLGWTRQLFSDWNIDRKETLHTEFDFGKHEYGAIATVDHVIRQIKNSVIGQVIDTDIAGRDLSQQNLKTLLKHPHKSYGYAIAKGYYLFLGNHLKEDFIEGVDDNFDWSEMYNSMFPKIWAKRQQLDKNAFIRKLSKEIT